MVESSDEALAARAWRDETLRLYARYQQEFVEAFDFCPWAKRARLGGRVRVEVNLESALAPRPVLSQLDVWVGDPKIEIGILIFPRAHVGREEMERFATACMAADSKRLGLQSAEFVLAAFHPDAPLITESPERLVPFLRRSPDPTLQFVRVSALERVRRGESHGTQFVDISNLDLSALTGQSKSPLPSLRERVLGANHDTLQRSGVDPITAVLEDIARDREATRARLAKLGELPELAALERSEPSKDRPKGAADDA